MRLIRELRSHLHYKIILPFLLLSAIAAACLVTACQSKPDTGRTPPVQAVTVTADTPDLKALSGPCDRSFNDCVSSLRVTKQ